MFCTACQLELEYIQDKYYPVVNTRVVHCDSGHMNYVRDDKKGLRVMTKHEYLEMFNSGEMKIPKKK